MQTTFAPGKLFLLVTGILLIIGGVLGTIIALLAVVGGGALGAMGMGVGMGDEGTAAAVIGGFVLVIGIIALINSVFNLIAGICGVKNASKPEKANTCFILGVIMLIFPVITLVVTVVSSDFQVSSLLSALAGMVVPALYTIGAQKNKSAA